MDNHLFVLIDDDIISYRMCMIYISSLPTNQPIVSSKSRDDYKLSS